MEINVRNLHPLEIRLLRDVTLDDVITRDKIIDDLGYNIGQCNQAFSWLEAKGFIEETERTKKTFYELTDYGRALREKGLSVIRMVDILKKGPLTLPEIAEKLSLEQSEVGSSFGSLTKNKIAKLNDERKAELISDSIPEDAILQKSILETKGDLIEESTLTLSEKSAIQALSKKRGASSSPYKISEREDVFYRLTELGNEAKKEIEKSRITGEEFGLLTPEMLSSGSWKEGSFRPYGVNSPTQRLIPGRFNPYGDYIKWVKDKLTSLGFEEFDGPLVENEFWNGDALFMPQFHSARDIHDVYYVKDPSHAKSIEEPWLSQVKKTHENGWKTGSRGWGYKFDHEFTRRQILRSQGTVLSAHQLTKAHIPGKYFGVVRCFRYDQVDATHGADFYQTEGIVLGEDVNLKNLLGLLKMFAEEIAGAEQVKYVPGYFPFTEPSIEVHIKHPVLGWFELGGSGIFRPEVTKALGVDVPVLAWGLGIDRMALMHLGLNDLRELFTPNIESIRTRRVN